MHIGAVMDKLTEKWLGKHGVTAIFEDGNRPLPTIVFWVDKKREGVAYPTKFKRYTIVVEEGNLNFMGEGRSRYLTAR